MNGLDPAGRLNYTGDLTPIVERACEAYGVGSLVSQSIIPVGFEDCNVIIETDQAKFVAKMFAKFRTPEDIDRYKAIMQRVVEAGVSHPELMTIKGDELVYSDSGVSMVLMRFIEGKSFYELERVPNDQERRAIIEQAAKVNNIDYKPPYLFDSWAIPHIHEMLDKVRQFVQPEDMELVEQALARYDAIPVKELPHCFVHGDFIKTNIMLGDDGQIYILDFSVANTYPRIQELAVIAANLLHDEGDMTLEQKCQLVADEYSEFSPITDEERKYLPDYALVGATMEFLGGHQEKFINGNDGEETDFWLNLGRNGLRRALQ